MAFKCHSLFIKKVYVGKLCLENKFRSTSSKFKTMKKLIFVLNIIFFTTGYSYTQTLSLAYDVMGYEGNDRGVGISEMEDALLLTSGSICNTTTGCFGIIKTDLDGNEQWTVRFNNLPNRISAPISDPIKKENGNYVIGSTIWNSNSDDAARVYLMEFDSQNTLVWRQEYGISTYGRGVKKMDDGGFLLYGMKWNGSIKKRYYVKTDSLGNMEWERTLPLVEGSDSDNVGDMELLEDGNILQMIGTQSTMVADGKTLLLMDSDLNTIRSKNLNQLNWPINAAGNIARKKIDGGYVVPLYVDTISNLEFAADAHVLLGLDSLFNIEWVLPFPAYGIKPIYNIIIAENGDIIGCGTDNTFKADAEPDVTLNAGWLFRISPEGELLWERQYYIEEHLAWNGAFDLADVIEISDGRIAATGVRMDHRDNGTIDGNVWLLIVDENGCLTPDCEEQAILITATEEPLEGGLGKFKEVFFKLSPNPASDNVSIDFYNTLRQRGQMSIYSASGRLLYKKRLDKGIRNHQIDVTDFPKGIYVVSYESIGHVLQKEQLIVH